MSRGSKWLAKTGGLIASEMMRGWMKTLDAQVAFYDPLADPAHPDYADSCIYLFWHEYILVPVSMRGHCNVNMLLSQHQDAEFLFEAGRFIVANSPRVVFFLRQSYACRWFVWGMDTTGLGGFARPGINLRFPVRLAEFAPSSDHEFKFLKSSTGLSYLSIPSRLKHSSPA